MKSKRKLLRRWLALFLVFSILMQQTLTMVSFAENDNASFVQNDISASESTDLLNKTAESSEIGNKDNEKAPEVSEPASEQETAEASTSEQEVAEASTSEQEAAEASTSEQEAIEASISEQETAEASTSEIEAAKVSVLERKNVKPLDVKDEKSDKNRQNRAELGHDVITKLWITDIDGKPFEEGAAIGAWQPFRLYAEYNLPDNVVKEGDTTTMVLPVGFNTSPPDHFEIKDGDEVIAKATMYNENPAKIVLKYTKYAEEHSGVHGSFHFNVSVNAETQTEQGKIPVTLSVNGKLIPAGDINYKPPHFISKQLTKAGWMTSDKTRGRYDIRLNQNNEVLVNAKFIDTIQSDSVEFDENSIQVFQGQWENKTTVMLFHNRKDVTQEFKDAGKIKFDGKQLTIDIGNIPEENENRGFQIFYEVKLKYEPLAGEVIENKAEFTNGGNNVEQNSSYKIIDAGGIGEGYVYKIQVLKTGENNTPLKGAKFDVIRVRNNQTVGTIETGSDGKAEIGKLLKDEYKLVETEAPKGYELLKDPISVKISDFGTNKIALKNISNKLYTAEGSWTPSVTKKLTGRTLKDNEFTFELKENDNVLQTVKNKADGTIPFEAVNYTLKDVGEHTYTITEKNTSLSGVTYDEMVVTYKVKVADKGNGTLEATVTEVPNDTEFNNTYKATGSWTPSVTKKLTGRTLKDNEFTFELKENDNVLQTVKNKADGTIPFEAVNYTLKDVGEHTYTITEKKESLPGVTYDEMTVTYKVKVADKGDGTLEVTVTEVPNDTEFNNIYEAAGSWKPSVTKKLTGRALKDNEFTFELKENGNVLQTVKNKADGTIPFDEINYKAEDVGDHTYVIAEKKESLSGITYDEMTVTYKVHVKDSATGKLEVTVGGVPEDTEFNNTYKAEGSWKPSVTKTLTGRTLENEEFEFELKENGKVLQTVKNEYNGAIPFKAVEYTLANVGEHTYTITEKKGSLPGVTYDEMVVTYKVKVADKGNGTLEATVTEAPEDTEFNNTYKATGSWTPSVTKKLTGRELKDNEFEFELKENGKVLQTVKNKADGTIPFAVIEYTLDDLGEHTYIIEEKEGNLPGVVHYDSMVVVYKVLVTDKGDGTLEIEVTKAPYDTEFNNIYKAEGSWKPLVTKTLTGRTLKDNEFEFELKEGNTVLQTVKNKADGTIPFDEINYTLDNKGDHTYTITEKVGTLPGIAYDSHVIVFEVNVSDDGEGNLVTSTKISPADMVPSFNNIYTADGSWKPAATKVLTGRELKDNEFEFELKENGKVLQTVKNKADGTVPFEELNYTLEDAGEHTYTITEKKGSLPGVTYDDKTVTYKIKVTDKGDGTLESTVITAPDDIKFNNVYEASGSWKPSVTKVLTGRELKDNEFEFELKENGKVLQTVKNKADGTIPFEELNYKLSDAGEHTYTITEKKGSLPGVTYDDMTVTYKVKVTDKGDGTLESTVTAAPKDTEFNNTYSVEVTFSKVALGQREELEGAKLTVKKTDGTVIESWTSGKTAKVLKLVAGEYVMIEEQAPQGYEKASAITFRVNIDGSVEVKEGNNWVAVRDAKIQMVDTLKPSKPVGPKTGDESRLGMWIAGIVSAFVSFFVLNRMKKLSGKSKQ